MMPLTGEGVLVVAAKECGDAESAAALATRLTQMGMTVWIRGTDKNESADLDMEG